MTILFGTAVFKSEMLVSNRGWKPLPQVPRKS